MKAPTDPIAACEEIIKKINDYDSKGKSSYNGQSVILLIGPTGVGKSTLIELIKGKTMKIKKVTVKGERGMQKQKIVIDSDNSNIGHSRVSETQTPIENNINGSIILDCPGFEDSQGVVAEIIHSYQLYQIVKDVAQIKILIVASEYEMGSERAHLIEKTIERAMVMIGIQDTSKFGLAITKCDSHNLDELFYDPVILEKFQHIFLFPKPKTSSGEYNFETTGLTNLFQFINDQTTFIKISNPSVSLNPESLRLLEQVVNIQNAKNRDLLKTLADEILSEHEDRCTLGLGKIEENYNDFSLMKKRLEQINSLWKANNTIKGAEDFVNCFISSQLDYGENVLETLNKIRKTNNFSDFLKNIFKQDKITLGFKSSLCSFYKSTITDLRNKIRYMEEKLFNKSKNQFLDEFKEQLPEPETGKLLQEFNVQADPIKEKCFKLKMDEEKKEELFNEFKKDAKAIYDYQVMVYDKYDENEWGKNKNSFISNFETEFQSNLNQNPSNLPEFDTLYNQMKQNQNSFKNPLYNDFTTFVIIIPGWNEENGEKFTKRERELNSAAKKLYEYLFSSHEKANDKKWQVTKEQLLNQFEHLLPNPKSVTSINSLDYYIDKVKKNNPELKMDEHQERDFRGTADRYIFKLFEKDFEDAIKERNSKEWENNKNNFLVYFQDKLKTSYSNGLTFDKIFNDVKGSISISMDSIKETELKSAARKIFAEYELQHTLLKQKIERFPYTKHFKKHRIFTYGRTGKKVEYCHHWQEEWVEIKDGLGNLKEDKYVKKINGSDKFINEETNGPITESEMLNCLKDNTIYDSQLVHPDSITWD